MAKNLEAAKWARLLLNVDEVRSAIGAYDEMLSQDEKRLIWTVWAYNASISADRLDFAFVAGDFCLPSDPGMASAHAIATIACGAPTSPRSGRLPDPVKAGELWLFRLKRRMQNDSDASAIITTFLKFLPEKRGRPTKN